MPTLSDGATIYPVFHVSKLRDRIGTSITSLDLPHFTTIDELDLFRKLLWITIVCVVIDGWSRSTSFGGMDFP